ncbi:deoxycytidylate deaminase [Sporomusa acidovorans]|uniref:CMP/dCMP-type deaminase domain-containing protein n=1 Tax=Sporomusa acidovorans (strain ATCC 49682 / DSM 3132 / Mol) TaxID=1123286 RepID=A0ABZ3J8L8_SPOA4|nr:cytidine/deoxycytidylate deaminase family protein [Sporomusa acidovorans]OZC21194.1 tRNA-specific adenosine deaminase [Sporomusa acidovorans DSM 3132]SDE64389.1 dCMP deaminase [Sporomusa acidovorans]
MHDNQDPVRPSWDEYFMEITKVVATRSTCLRRQIGAVIVKDRRLLSTGYNGAPCGLPHCGEVGCVRAVNHVPSGQRQELCRGLHAEQSAVVQAAMYGVPIRGATIYSTHQPCSACTKILINAGIIRIVYQYSYPDKLAEQLIAEAAIDYICFDKADI